jgi:para-nitrobenzyl esterase
MPSRVLFALFSIAAFAAIPEPIKTDAGQLTGVAGKDATVRVFKGIPFAAPPTGANRWKAPQPAAKWTGVKAASQFGSPCTAGTAAGKGKGSAASEDCLYLNVWTAAAAANEKRPVLVWSYGGGFTNGSGASGQFDGEALAKKGAIVVTYNYRLGVFGFFSHPALTAESGKNASGNYGLMDLAATLRWVKSNIANFGGDPNKVTIIGESAGSILGAFLTASPEGKGLFQRVIGQSGGWLSPGISHIRTLAEAEEQGARAAGANTLTQLRAMSAQEVAALLRVDTRPIVDGWFIREDPSRTFRSEKQNKVDVLLGSNQDEGTFTGIGPAITPQMIESYGPLSTEFTRIYPADNADKAALSGRTLGRDIFGWQMRTWAKAHNKAYLYYFTRVPPGQEARGATHGAEIPYVFGIPANSWTADDRKLSDLMGTYWVNFAKTGDPNGEGLPKWLEYDEKANDGRAMVLGLTIGFNQQITPDRLKFFDQVYARLF